MPRYIYWAGIALIAIAFFAGAWWKSGDTDAIEAARQAFEDKVEALEADNTRLAEEAAKSLAERQSEAVAADSAYARGVLEGKRREAAEQRMAAAKNAPDVSVERVALELRGLGYNPFTSSRGYIGSDFVGFDGAGANAVLRVARVAVECEEALEASKAQAASFDEAICNLRSALAWDDKAFDALNGQIANYEEGRGLYDGQLKVEQDALAAANRRVWLWKAVAVGATGLAVYAGAQ